MPPWPSVSYPPTVFSPDATALIQRLLNVNSYMRADYEICVKSPFLTMYGQGENNPPIIRDSTNRLFNHLIQTEN